MLDTNYHLVFHLYELAVRVTYPSVVFFINSIDNPEKIYDIDQGNAFLIIFTISFFFICQHALRINCPPIVFAHVHIVLFSPPENKSYFVVSAFLVCAIGKVDKILE